MPAAGGKGPGPLPAGGVRYFRKWLFDATIQEIDWSLGMIRDRPLSALGPGTSYTLTDFFCDRPGMLYKRGGTSYQNSVLTGFGDIVAISTPPFVGDPRIIALASQGTKTSIFDVTTGQTPTEIAFSPSAVVEPYENPTIYVGDSSLNPMRVVYTDGAGLTPPKKVYLSSGTVTVGRLGGTVIANPPENNSGSITGVAATVVSLTRSSSTVTVVTQQAHNMVVGQDVSIAGASVGTYDGIWTVESVPTATSFKFNIGSTPANATGGTAVGMPPYGVCSCSHLGFLVIAGGAGALQSPSQVITQANRVWISSYPDAEGSWDMQYNWFDVDEPIVGVASVGGALLIFSRGRCWRIIGSEPPDTPNPSDPMVLQPAGDIGCVDARSLVIMNDLCYVANESGIYSTAGNGTFTNVTHGPKGEGISRLWQSLMSDFTPQVDALVACGTWMDQYLLVSVVDDVGNRYAFIYYIYPATETTFGGSWMQTNPLTTCANMYATSDSPNQNIYIGPNNQSSARAVALGGMWTPTASNKNDHDGTHVQPLYSSRLLSDSIGMKRYGLGYLTYRMTDAASDDPTLVVGTATGYEQDSGFANVIESPLLDTSTVLRKRITLAKDSQGLTVQIQQSGPSANTEIYVLETELAPYYVADGS